MIWLNGELIEEESARIHPMDRGLLLGDGLFETMPAHGGVPRQLKAHLDRLSHGAGIVGIPLPFDVPRIGEAVLALIEANGLKRKEAAVRVTLTRGPGKRGLPPPDAPSPTLMINASEYRQVPDGDGLSATIDPEFRRNEGSPLSRLKSLCYMDGVLALAAAARAGHDEALLLNNAGKLACATRANLFLCLGRRLVTPPASDGILPGITRASVIEMARGQGYEVEETSIDPAQIAAATGAFVTNSLIGIRWLRRIDGKEFSKGEMSRKLSDAYRDLSG